MKMVAVASNEYATVGALKWIIAPLNANPIPETMKW